MKNRNYFGKSILLLGILLLGTLHLAIGKVEGFPTVLTSKFSPDILNSVGELLEMVPPSLKKWSYQTMDF